MQDIEIKESFNEKLVEQEPNKEQLTQDKRSLYQETCYNRDSTLVAKYVNRIVDDYPTPSERYYDIRVMSREGRQSYFGEVGDQCIMFHSNRICLLTIAPTHPVITLDKTVERVEHTFDGFEKIDRTASQPRGKGKKGSQKLQKNSPVCALICTDGSKYIVTACMGAKLLEINQEICEKPNLVKERPLSTGYIAILQPNNYQRSAEIKESLPKLGEPIMVSPVDSGECTA